MLAKEGDIRYKTTHVSGLVLFSLTGQECSSRVAVIKHKSLPVNIFFCCNKCTRDTETEESHWLEGCHLGVFYFLSILPPLLRRTNRSTRTPPPSNPNYGLLCIIKHEFCCRRRHSWNQNIIRTVTVRGWSWRSVTAPIFKGLELWSSADCWAMSCLINGMFSSTFSYQEIHKQKQISEDAYCG